MADDLPGGLPGHLADAGPQIRRERLAIAPGAGQDRLAGRRAEAPCEPGRRELLEANARDIAAAPDYGLNAAAIDRLTLDPERIDEMAAALVEVAALPDPVGEVIASSRPPQRAGRHEGPRAAGRDLLHLRDPART